MSKNAFLALIVALFIPLAGYFIFKALTDDAVVMPRHYYVDTVISKTVRGKQVQDTVWERLPDWTFTNQLGQQVSANSLDGKIVVASFFFTHCPTICPKMTVHTKRLQDGITSAQRVGNKQAKYVQFVSFSMDPERDSVPRLKAWADRFDIDPANWWLLTGNKQQIYDLSINKMKLGLIDGEGVDTAFYHTDYMVLIDRDRHVRGYYHGLDTTALARMANDVVLLSLEKDPKRKSFFAGKLELLAIVFGITAVGLILLILFLRRGDKRMTTPQRTEVKEDWQGA